MVAYMNGTIMVALPTTNGITTFNMVELAPYFKDDPLANLTINLFQQRGMMEIYPRGMTWAFNSVK